VAERGLSEAGMEWPIGGGGSCIKGSEAVGEDTRPDLSNALSIRFFDLPMCSLKISGFENLWSKIMKNVVHRLITCQFRSRQN
jgi:hypothetical protein